MIYPKILSHLQQISIYRISTLALCLLVFSLPSFAHEIVRTQTVIPTFDNYRGDGRIRADRGEAYSFKLFQTCKKKKNCKTRTSDTDDLEVFPTRGTRATYEPVSFDLFDESLGELYGVVIEVRFDEGYFRVVEPLVASGVYGHKVINNPRPKPVDACWEFNVLKASFNTCNVDTSGSATLYLANTAGYRSSGSIQEYTSISDTQDPKRNHVDLRNNIHLRQTLLPEEYYAITEGKRDFVNHIETYVRFDGSVRCSGYPSKTSIWLHSRSCRGGLLGHIVAGPKTNKTIIPHLSMTVKYKYRH